MQLSNFVITPKLNTMQMLRSLNCCCFSLTITVISLWVVEGQAQRNDGSYLQDDERDVLQCLPHQLQEGLGFFRRDEVPPEGRVALFQVRRVSREPWRSRTNGAL